MKVTHQYTFTLLPSSNADKDRMLAMLTREANELLNEAEWVLENRNTAILGMDGMMRESRIDLILAMNKR